MRDLTGKHFTLREAQYTWRKACVEFAKCLDPDTGFYYFTSSHDRYYEGERPHFDEDTTQVKQKRVRRREQPSNHMFGRATLPVPSSRSTRMKFHNLPIELPPVPGAENQTFARTFLSHKQVAFTHMGSITFHQLDPVDQPSQ